MPANAQVSPQTLQQQMMAFRQGRFSPLTVMRSPSVSVPIISVPVSKLAFVQVPVAYGTAVQILMYQVPVGYWFEGVAIVLQFAGTGPAPNPGDVSFTVDVNRPLGDTTAGYPVKDYSAIPFVLGSLTGGFPWPIDFKQKNGEIIRLKATPVANMGLGVGNNFVGALFGYEWPMQGDEG